MEKVSGIQERLWENLYRRQGFTRTIMSQKKKREYKKYIIYASYPIIK